VFIITIYPTIRSCTNTIISPFLFHLPALNLLEKLLELDPKKRITARAALNHRYFRVEPLAPTDPTELGTMNLTTTSRRSGIFLGTSLSLDSFALETFIA
jgi:serine/threonine protein kinase